MKRFIVFCLLVIISINAYGEKLFDYRGVFSAKRKNDAFITNYMLLKKASTVRFEIIEPGKGPSDRVVISSVTLTSDPKVTFTDPSGIKTLDLEKTGIYEIKLMPAAVRGGEIPFLLRVLKEEQRKKAETQKDFSVELKPVTVPKKIVSNINQASVVASKTVNIVPEIVTVEIASKSVAISSETEEIATTSLAISSATVSLPDKKNPKIELLSPELYSFINPLNGIEVAYENLGTDTIKFEEILTVHYLNKSGIKELVKGSFFSDKVGSFKFLPFQIISGCVYHISLFNPESGKLVQEARVSALPEMDCEIDAQTDTTYVSLFWKQNLKLLPNPVGQLIRLANSELEIIEKGNEIFKLKFHENLSPFGSKDKIKFRAAPYRFKLEIPGSRPDLKVILRARIDGNTHPVTVLEKSLQKKAIITDTNSEVSEDFSNVPALPALSDESKIQKPISKLKNVKEHITLKLENSIDLNRSNKSFVQPWPQDLVWDDQGNIWVLDGQQRAVSCYDISGKLILTLSGTEKAKSEGLRYPSAIGFANSFILVSDRKRHEVFKFSSSGSYVGKLGNGKLKPDFLRNPAGLCQRNKEIWIAEKSKNQILCFDSNDKFLGKFGSEGKNSLKKPINVKSDKENLIVLEKSGIIKFFSPIGEYISEFNTSIKNPGNLWVDKWNYIWITEPDGYLVKRFDKEGKLLTTIEPPPAPKPWLPTGVCVREDGKVIISDAMNKKVFIYQLYEN